MAVEHCRSSDRVLFLLKLTTCSAEWRSSPSSILVCRTNVDKPGPPAAPRVSAVTSHSFCMSWGEVTSSTFHSPFHSWSTWPCFNIWTFSCVHSQSHQMMMEAVKISRTCWKCLKGIQEVALLTSAFSIPFLPSLWKFPSEETRWREP